MQEGFIKNLLTGIRQWVNGKIADINTAIEGKQDVLTAGDNIEIDGAGTISVTGFASWAKQPNKPSYTPQEVGAMPADTVIIDDSVATSGTTYSSQKILQLLGEVGQFHVEVVNELPATGDTHTIYFVPADASGVTSGATSDYMDEYMYVNGEWELIGTTRIDLSDYYTVTEVNKLLDEKLDIPDVSVQDVLDELDQED